MAFSTLVLGGLPAKAQVVSNSNSSKDTITVTYVAVLPDQQQPPQNPNPNAPAQPAAPQPPPARKPKYEIFIGPNAGVYLPTSSKTQTRFGSDWLDYGVSFYPVYASPSKGRLSLDLQVLANTSGDDSLFFGLIGLDYRRSMLREHTAKPEKASPNAQPNAQPPVPQLARPRRPDYIPYFGFSADEVVGDLVAVEDGVHSGVRTGVAGSAFIGVTWRNRAYIEARYLKLSELKGFDLSGFSLNVGCRFRISGN